MANSIKTVFPSYIYQGTLAQARRLNREFKKEITALEQVDDFGRKWSEKNYQGGYSSYSSMCRLHLTSPNFAELETLLKPHVQKFVRKLKWDLLGGEIAMTTCWANSMAQGTYHTLHLHPGSVISGVYYVDLPPGSSVLKFEDPRMAMLMAAPPRKSRAPSSEQNYLLLPGSPGKLFLFESWMRHEVPPHRVQRNRVSISFNYEWI